MRKITKPRKSWKKERVVSAKTGVPLPSLLWHESKDYFERLWAYCKQDVLAEEALSQALPDLSPAETQIYLLDQAINQRGFALDRQAVNTALHLMATETAVLNAELAALTTGRVKKATQRAQLLTYLQEHEGVELDDTQKETIDHALQYDFLSESGRRILEIVRALGRSSTAKYTTMRDQMDPESGRIRGALLYHGATTGRWSGSGVQPHNFPKGKIKDQEAHWNQLKTNPTTIPNIMDSLSQGLRGAIIASPGSQLYVADYAAIEARVVMWLADDEEHLDIFRRHEDIYSDMASTIYDKPCNKADHPDERALGKIAVLGLGYQMGASKFQATCEAAGIQVDEGFAAQVVDAYREKYWRIKNMWWAQEAAAVRAAGCREGEEVIEGRITWVKEGRFLYYILPSGRRLAYPDPEVRPNMTPWGEIRPQLTFMGVNGYSHKWQRTHTYGGSLVENQTQAVARDVLAEAMIRCEKRGYPIVLTVHDEIISETPLAFGSVTEFEDILTENPTWGKDLPLGAEGWSGTRYHK